MSEFFRKIKRLFGFLYIKYNMIETERKCDKKNFGNSKIILVSEKFKFIFTRDRDFDSVGISAMIDPKEEFDLHLVKAYILGDTIDGEYIKRCNLSVLAKFMNKNYEKIEKEFSKEKYPRTKKCLKELEEIRHQKLFRGK